MKTLALTAILTLSTGATALAQMSPLPSPPPAPQAPAAPAPPPPVASGPAAEIANPADLSTINGQLVPIGEHNEYHYTFRPWNLAANPIGWMIGIYGISGSYALGQHLALRGEIDYYHPVGASDTTGFEIDASLPIYFRRTYQGAFLEPGFMSRQITTADSWSGTSSTSTEAGPEMLLGWHWSWDGGLNIAMAAGVGRNLSSQGGVEPTYPNGYLRFGYEF